MDIDITIKNYRCFPRRTPARIQVRPGFTAFVGLNNSGKSSLLRFFYEFRELFRFIAPGSPAFVHALAGRGHSLTFPRHIADVDEIFSDSAKGDLEIEIRAQPLNRRGPTPPEWLRLTVLRGTNTVTAELDPMSHVFDRQSLAFAAGNNQVLQGGPSQGVRFDVSGFFDAAKILAQTLYVGPFRNAINTGTNEDYFDVTVGQAFIKAWRQLKTGNAKRANEAAYGLTQDIARIFEFQELEINPSPDDSTLQVFINGKSYRLSAVGSGLAQFILVLASAADRHPSYILIDEPESNLHPSLQLDFLTTLASYAAEGILFATHSVGLARASADQVYAVKAIKDGESQVVPFEGLRSLPEFLGEMSYSGYNELGFSKILLVEGVNEVKTVQQFLRLHRLDHKIVLLHLGGSALINGERELELAEVKRISANVEALVDSERDSREKDLASPRAAFAELCKKLQIRCHVLDRRATENYFTDRAVKKVKGEKYRALGPYERLQEANPSWAKAENWRIAREMSLKDLEGTDLGSILASLSG
jgi:predicted ATPase